MAVFEEFGADALLYTEYSGECVPLIPDESVPPIPRQNVPLIPRQSVPPFQDGFALRTYTILSNFLLLIDSPFNSSR